MDVAVVVILLSTSCIYGKKVIEDVRIDRYTTLSKITTSLSSNTIIYDTLLLLVLLLLLIPVVAAAVDGLLLLLVKPLPGTNSFALTFNFVTVVAVLEGTEILLLLLPPSVVMAATADSLLSLLLLLLIWTKQ